jgi:hypothetical protein
VGLSRPLLEARFTRAGAETWLNLLLEVKAPKLKRKPADTDEFEQTFRDELLEPLPKKPGRGLVAEWG